MSTHLPMFQSFFRFLHHFVFAKSATSNIGVKLVNFLSTYPLSQGTEPIKIFLFFTLHSLLPLREIPALLEYCNSRVNDVPGSPSNEQRAHFPSVSLQRGQKLPSHALMQPRFLGCHMYFFCHLFLLPGTKQSRWPQWQIQSTFVSPGFSLIVTNLQRYEQEYELYYSLTAIYDTQRKYNNIIRKNITINNVVGITKIQI